MNLDGQRKLRKTLLVNLAWVMAPMVLLFLGYVLSYAPAYRWTYGPDPGFFFGSADDGSALKVFGPVEWLMDQTPLYGVLLKWADVWGVSKGMEFESNLRVGFLLPGDDPRH